MKLKIYDWKRPAVKPPKSKFQTVGLNRHGRFCFSHAAQEVLGFEDGQYVAFAKDEDSRNDWYVTFEADCNTGSKIRLAKNSRNKKGSLITNNKEAANAILDTVKAEKGASLLIARVPTPINGKNWYKILTAKPMRIE